MIIPISIRDLSSSLLHRSFGVNYAPTAACSEVGPVYHKLLTLGQVLKPRDQTPRTRWANTIATRYRRSELTPVIRRSPCLRTSSSRWGLGGAVIRPPNLKALRIALIW